MRFTYTLYEPSMAPELDGFLDEAAPIIPAVRTTA